MEPIKTDNYLNSMRWVAVNKGILTVDFDIEFDEARTFIHEIKEMMELPVEKVTMFINSRGGGAYDALAIYDNLIELSKSGKHITAIVEGIAASAAAQIVLQAADLRLCRPSAKLMIHEVRRLVAWSVEKASDMKDEADQFDKLNNAIIEIMSKRCGHTIEEVRDTITRRDVWFSAREALDWGLVDGIKE